MRRFRWVLTLVGFALSVPAASATAFYDPVHPERERMSASARRKAVLDDLDDLLAGPATATSIATRPRTVSNQLCARDVIAIQYQHAKLGDQKSPFKPFRIFYVIQQYHLIGYPEALSQSDASKACQSLDQTKDYWANGGNEGIALDGLWTLMDVVAAVRAKSGSTFDCKALEDAALEARCAQEFLTLADHPKYVDDCPGQPHEEGQQCFGYGFERYRATIIRSRSTSGTPTDTVKLEWAESIF